MNSYKIVANDQDLDTFEGESVSLNYQIEDILDIEKRNTNFSKTINLPGTKGNNLFFNQIFDVNIDNINFNPNVKIPASITIGDNTVMDGNLQLLNISIVNEEVEYQVAVFGTLKNIVNDFGDYTLRNLDLSEYDHTRNQATIAASWYNTIKYNGNDIYAPNEGRGYVYPYIVNGNSSDIYDNVYIYDLYPAVYVKTYLDKMFEFTGFTYSSKFFNSEYFKRLILPFTEDKIQLNPTDIQARKAIVSLNGDDPDDSEYKGLLVRNRGGGWIYNTIFSAVGQPYYLGLDRESGTVDDGGTEVTFTDELGQWNGNIFTCDEPGKYDIRFTAQAFLKLVRTNGGNIEYNQGQFQYSYFLELEKTDGTVLELDSSRTDDQTDGTQYLTLDSGVHASPWFDTNSQIAMGMSADNVWLSTGDKIRVKIGFNYPDAVTWTTPTNNNNVTATLVFKESFDGNFTKMSVTPSGNQSYGNETISMNSILSDMKMKDLFMDLVKTFNLVVKDDPNNPTNLIIEPYDDFFKSRQKVKDWTQLLDRDSEIKITPMSELDAKTFLYSYTDDDDHYNKDYREETKQTYGELSVTILNDFSEKTQKNEIKFAPTPVSDYQINDRVAPFFVEKNDEGMKPKKVKPRLLFYNGVQTCSSWTLKDNQDDTGSALEIYPYCGMWDSPNSPEETLEFGMPEKLYFDTSVIPTNNLYKRFHRAKLKNVTDKNARLFEGSFKLTPKDIADFDFRDLIFIDGSYWRVNQIKDFDPIGSDKLTKVVLYKIIDLNVINKYTEDIPSSNDYCPSDVIIITGIKDYYASVSGQPISQACCQSLGGDWDGSVCWVAPNQPLNGVPDDGALLMSGARVPSTEPNGTLSAQIDNNSQNANGVKIQGSQNYIPPQTKNGLILGDKNSVSKTVENFVAIGDGQKIDESGIYIDGLKITGDGITKTGNVIIDGGEDVVLPVLKTNQIDVVDGGLDAVRNFGGDSKSRPIIDGGYDSVNEIEP